jgi:hypothetical protein
MTVRVFIIGSLLAAAGSWAMWLLIIRYLDPGQAGLLGFFLFFLTLFLAASSTASLLGFGLRRLISREVLAAYAVRAALRQGVLLGLFLNLLLVLQLANLYTWWLAIIAIVLFITTELIFLGYDRSHRRTSRQTGERS